MIQRDEDVLRLDVQVHEHLGVDVLQALGQVEQDALQLGLGEPLARVPELVDFRGQAAPLAILVLDVDSTGLDPGVVVAHHVLVLDQGRVGEHFVHGHALLVCIAMDLVSGDLEKAFLN